MKIIISLLCLLVASVPACADNVDPAIAKKAQTYLNTIKTLQSRYTQTAPNNVVSTGTLYLKRPGKMRWEYDPPVPVIITALGGIMRYYDYELEQVSNIPIQDSLAGLLASKTVNFSDDTINVLQASSEDQVHTVRIARAGQLDEGTISFVFEDSPYQLRKIVMKDARGDITHVALNNADVNIALDDDLFTQHIASPKRRK